MFSSLAACCLASLTSRNLPCRNSAISRALRSSPSTITSSPAQRHVGQALDLDRNRRAGLVDRLAVLVGHRAHAAEDRAGEHDVAALQRARLHQDRRDRAAALVEARLDDDAPGRRVHVGALSSSTSACSSNRSSSWSMPVAGLRRHRDELHVRRRIPPARTPSATSSCLTRSGLASGLSILLIATTSGTLAGLGVRDRLLGLRHHAVVGRDHQHHDVGDLGAARAHGGERLVARRVEERDDALRRSRRGRRRCAA